MAYTPLHGVGATTATEAFAAAGFPALHIVADQAPINSPKTWLISGAVVKSPVRPIGWTRR